MLLAIVPAFSRGPLAAGTAPGGEGAFQPIEEELATARRLALEGKYAEAEEIFGRHVPDHPEAVLGLARAQAATGQDPRAVRLLLRTAKDHPALHAELARLALARGDYAVAEVHAEIAVALEPDQLLARWLRAELSRLAGRLEEADEGYRWFVRYHNTHAVDDAESLCWIGLAVARYARWNRLPDQFSFLVNDLYPRAIQRDPACWRAHYQSGLLFLEKYNRADAKRDLEAALKLNPNAAEVHAAVARLALEEHDYAQAEQSVQRALELNPRLLEAWLLKADLAWANFDARQAAQVLRQHALPLNPVAEATWGRLAACCLLEGDRPEGQDAPGLPGPPSEGVDATLAGDPFPRIVRQVTSRNPACGDFFFTLARRLEDRNKIPQAERFFRETIARMPQKIGPYAHLGLLAMHTGREDQAASLLEKAFRDDPFNVRVYNTLEVLDLMKTMASRDTGHCVLRFDGQSDALLAQYAAEVLEEMYPELCRQFGYRPPQKPLVEIFHQCQGTDGHAWFSARMIGLPYLGTVAASTGMVVALVSPNDPGLSAPFNWVRVLRHELVHVITLQQTDFNCPHWYTEALAVSAEGTPRPAAWNRLLARHADAGPWFTLDTINFGFTRPQSSDAWAMAYCQAELYVDFIRETYGQEPIHRLLDAFADRLATREAIRQVFGTSLEEFERAFGEYFRRLGRRMKSLEPEEERSLAELLEAQRDDPDDPDLAARLAAAYLRRDEASEARRWAETAREQAPQHPLATYVLARLDLRDGKTSQAVERLDKALDPTSPHPQVLNLLAALKLEGDDPGEAARLYALGHQHFPDDPRWLQALARAAMAAGDDRKLAEALAQLAEGDPDEPVYRRKLVDLALDRHDYPEAARWANRALEIDVTDPAVHRALAKALAAGHNEKEAIQEFEIAIQLDPETLPTYLELARTLLRSGERARAGQIIQEALRRRPDWTEALQLLKAVEEM